MKKKSKEKPQKHEVGCEILSKYFSFSVPYIVFLFIVFIVFYLFRICTAYCK